MPQVAQQHPCYLPLNNFIISSGPFSAFTQIFFHGRIRIHLLSGHRSWIKRTIMRPVPALPTPAPHPRRARSLAPQSRRMSRERHSPPPLP